MTNSMNNKFMEYSEKSGYNNSFIEKFMKRNDFLPKEFGFRKYALDLILKKYNKKIIDFVRDTYSPREQKNKLAQISKILNPKKNAPHYYTVNHLSYDLCTWVNNFSTTDVIISPEFFMGENMQINVVGSLYGSGQIILNKGKDLYKINVHPKYSTYSAIECQVDAKRGLMMLYQQTKNVDRLANNKTVICQDKKTKVIWYGYLDPISNGKFNILDKSASTGKTIGKLAENITLSWSAEIKAAYYPTIYNI